MLDELPPLFDRGSRVAEPTRGVADFEGRRPTDLLRDLTGDGDPGGKVLDARDVGGSRRLAVASGSERGPAVVRADSSTDGSSAVAADPDRRAGLGHRCR
jgi:hypothetical protein